MNTRVAEIDLKGRRVLVVEDEFYLAMELQNEIEAAGGTVIGPCASVNAALASMKSGVVDAAIVDINLGQGPSFEVSDALRAGDVPFLFLTGYDTTVVPDRFRDVVCIQKPTTVSVLLQKLSRSVLA